MKVLDHFVSDSDQDIVQFKDEGGKMYEIKSVRELHLSQSSPALPNDTLFYSDYFENDDNESYDGDIEEYIGILKRDMYGDVTVTGGIKYHDFSGLDLYKFFNTMNVMEDFIRVDPLVGINNISAQDSVFVSDDFLSVIDAPGVEYIRYYHDKSGKIIKTVSDNKLIKAGNTEDTVSTTPEWFDVVTSEFKGDSDGTQNRELNITGDKYETDKYTITNFSYRRMDTNTVRKNDGTKIIRIEKHTNFHIVARDSDVEYKYIVYSMVAYVNGYYSRYVFKVSKHRTDRYDSNKGLTEYPDEFICVMAEKKDDKFDVLVRRSVLEDTSTVGNESETYTSFSSKFVLSNTSYLVKLINLEYALYKRNIIAADDMFDLYNEAIKVGEVFLETDPVSYNKNIKYDLGDLRIYITRSNNDNEVAFEYKYSDKITTKLRSIEIGEKKLYRANITINGYFGIEDIQRSGIDIDQIIKDTKDIIEWTYNTSPVADEEDNKTVIVAIKNLASAEIVYDDIMFIESSDKVKCRISTGECYVIFNINVDYNDSKDYIYYSNDMSIGNDGSLSLYSNVSTKSTNDISDLETYFTIWDINKQEEGRDNKDILYKFIKDKLPAEELGMREENFNKWVEEVAKVILTNLERVTVRLQTNRL